MNEAMLRIADYISGMDLGRFERDHKTFDAVVRNLEIIGEAGRHLDDATRAGLPRVPWEDLRALRNGLAHRYFARDIGATWKTVSEDLPKIQPLIQAAIRGDGPPQ